MSLSKFPWVRVNCEIRTNFEFHNKYNNYYHNDFETDQNAIPTRYLHEKTHKNRSKTNRYVINNINYF